jgi:2-polyprenyl-6-methoxyphenol hydroxylase-like FAD-dependent oxidoreductase
LQEFDLPYDVIVAGGGPVGLFLACELRLAGVAVVVLERMEDPRTPLKENSMGMRGLNLPSVEAFYRRGLLDAVRGSAIGWMNVETNKGMEVADPKRADHAPAPRFAGHFAGIMLDANKIDFSNDNFTVGGSSASGGMVSLESIETILAERATELGVEVLLGSAVTDATQTEDGVTVRVGDEIVQAKWLVGCDGGRSTVRKCAEFEFPGTDAELTGTIALAEFADPEKLRPGWNITPTGMYVSGPVPGRMSVVDFDGGAAARESQVTVESFQETLRRVSGTDVTVTALHLATRYTDNARQAATYRKGRILLAGDAAHVHSPFGGQGLNLGIGDAMNLGWKLAAVVKGWTPESMLDTYTEERHPVGARILDWTRAQVAILRPEPHARAMAAIVRDLIDTRAGASYFARQIAGTWLRYNLPANHPLIGRSTPDLEFEDGTRLGTRMHQGAALLLDLSDDEMLRSLGGRWGERVKYVSGYASGKVKDSLGLTAMLVRPDGFVAWAAEGEPNLLEAAEAMTHWLGAPPGETAAAPACD